MAQTRRRSEGREDPLRLLLDLDGTLVDSRPGIRRGFEAAFVALGLEPPAPERVDPLIGLPLRECFERLGCGERSGQAAQAFQDFFWERGHAEGELYPGVTEMLAALKAAGIPLAIATAKPSDAGAMVARGLGIAERLEGVFGCEPQDLNPSKAPIVARALAELGWPREGTYLLGDRAQDRDAAQAEGIGFIAAAWGFGGAEEWKGAALVCQSPAQLWGSLVALKERT